MKYNLIHLALFLLFLSPSLYAQKNQETPNSADSCKVYVPNALSANMEGLQCFRVQFSCPVKSFKISVYNRWGEMLFEGSSVDKDNCTGWDYSLVKEGVYVWMLNYETGSQPPYAKHKQVGNVTIIK